MLEFTELPLERTPSKRDTEKTVLLTNKKASNLDSNTSGGTETNLFVQAQNQFTQNGDSLPDSQ